MKYELITSQSLKQDIKEFATMKIACIKYHKEFAEKLGLDDKVVFNYSELQALQNLDDPSHHHYLIKNDDGINVAAIHMKNSVSAIDEEQITYIKFIYVDPGYRGKGYASEILEKVKDQSLIPKFRDKGYCDLLEKAKARSSRIELECWYGMPANDIYIKLGFKELKTRYMYTIEKTNDDTSKWVPLFPELYFDWR